MLLSFITPGAVARLDRKFTFGLDATEQRGGRFVVAAFLTGEFCLCRDEFAPEGLSENSLRQCVGAFGSRCHAFFNFVGELEKSPPTGEQVQSVLQVAGG